MVSASAVAITVTIAFAVATSGDKIMSKPKNFDEETLLKRIVAARPHSERQGTCPQAFLDSCTPGGAYNAECCPAPSTCYTWQPFVGYSWHTSFCAIPCSTDADCDVEYMNTFCSPTGGAGALGAETGAPYCYDTYGAGESFCQCL